MQPRTAVLFFLLAAFMASVLILPRKGEARPPGKSLEECTLGSCPLSIYPPEITGELSYPLGTEITVLSTGDVNLFCSPAEAGTIIAFSPLPTEGTRIRAASRGTCLLETPQGNINLRFSRFR